MRQRVDVQVRQDGINQIERRPRHPATYPFFAKVVAVHSERMTCDVETLDGQVLYNMPVLARGGLVDGKPYGEVDLPAMDDQVLVMSAGYGERLRVIVGTVYPYLSNDYLAEVTNAADKLFTKKLFEPDMPLGYRRVFKSGVSVQIEEDGRIVVEAPDGTHVLFGGDAKILEVLDSHGNTIVADSAGVVVTDANGNDISMVSGKVTINGNLEVSQ